MPETDGQIARCTVTPQEQEEKAHELAENRRQGSAADTKSEAKDKQRVQRNVQKTAADQADHGVKGVALQPELIVEHQRCRHIRRSD